MKTYTTVLIDLDDTLLDFSGDEEKAVLAVLREFGVSCGDDVLLIYRKISGWHSFELGNPITAKDVIAYKLSVLLKMLCVTENTEALLERYYDIMLSSHTVKRGALKVLRELKKRGYGVYLTTNGFPDFQYKRIRQAKMGKLFDGFFISEEIDLRKPSRGYFEYVLRHIPQSDRKKVLVVGDAPSSDVFGGINSGLDTCWLNEGGKRTSSRRPTYTIENISQLLEIL